MTAPLTPADCDLTDFPFMPVMIARLKQSRSWLLCKRNPALAFYMLNLWTAAWHSKPAASIEDDDLVLADLAMCNDKTWAKVRGEVMRGWILCDDGRLYHPVVAEQAREAWERKCAQRARTEAARKARETNRKGPVTASATTYVTENATENVTASKGQGQGQGKEERESRGRATTPPDLYDDPKAISKRGRSSKALIPWPSEFALTAEMREYATKHGFDPEWLFEKFRNKAIAKGWTYKDWPAAFRNFAQSEQSYAVPARPNGARQDQAWRPPDV